METVASMKMPKTIASFSSSSYIVPSDTSQNVLKGLEESPETATKFEYQGYCPDFSDISDESYSFWNVPSHGKCPESCHTWSMPVSPRAFSDTPFPLSLTESHHAAVRNRTELALPHSKLSATSEYLFSDMMSNTDLPMMSEAFPVPSLSDWFKTKEQFSAEPLVRPSNENGCNFFLDKEPCSSSRSYANSFPTSHSNFEQSSPYVEYVPAAFGYEQYGEPRVNLEAVESAQTFNNGYLNGSHPNSEDYRSSLPMRNIGLPEQLPPDFITLEYFEELMGLSYEKADSVLQQKQENENLMHLSQTNETPLIIQSSNVHHMDCSGCSSNYTRQDVTHPSKSLGCQNHSLKAHSSKNEGSRFVRGSKSKKSIPESTPLKCVNVVSKDLSVHKAISTTGRIKHNQALPRSVVPNKFHKRNSGQNSSKKVSTKVNTQAKKAANQPLAKLAPAVDQFALVLTDHQSIDGSQNINVISAYKLTGSDVRNLCLPRTISLDVTGKSTVTLSESPISQSMISNPLFKPVDETLVHSTEDTAFRIEKTIPSSLLSIPVGQSGNEISLNSTGVSSDSRCNTTTENLVSVPICSSATYTSVDPKNSLISVTVGSDSIISPSRDQCEVQNNNNKSEFQNINSAHQDPYLISDFSITPTLDGVKANEGLNTKWIFLPVQPISNIYPTSVEKQSTNNTRLTKTMIAPSNDLFSSSKETNVVSVPTIPKRREKSTHFHQRRKTVKEMLKEQQEKKRLESLAREWFSTSQMLSNTSTPTKIMNSHSKNGPMEVVNLSECSIRKPSILILHPDRSGNSENCRNADGSIYNEQQQTEVSSEIDDVYVDVNENGVDTTYLQNSDILEEELVLCDKDDGSQTLRFSDCFTESFEMPSFCPGRVDGKEHRPRHYDLLSLEIGSFKVRDSLDFLGRTKAKFKVVFTRREFLYELPLSTVCEGGGDVVNDMNSTIHVVRIVVPFQSVTAIRCDNKGVDIQVNFLPRIYVGYRQSRLGIIATTNVYKQCPSSSDITRGEISRCRIHKLLLKPCQSDKLKMYLWHFDRRFQSLTGIPIDESDNRPLYSYEDAVLLLDLNSPFLKTQRKKLKKVSKMIPKHLPRRVPSILPQVCSCRKSCSSLRCSCVKAAQMCNSNRSVCVCLDCDNPLNIIESFGIDPEIVVIDSCLFQNIYSVSQLRRYLCQELQLPCCLNVATVKDCIPGTVLCPNNDCMQPIQYSWCREVLCSAERNPRNHCAKCGKCCFSTGRHCEKCNSCYFNRFSSPLCPICMGFNAVVSERKPISNNTDEQDEQRILPN